MSRKLTLVLLLSVFTGLLIRIYLVFRMPIWLDEYFTLQVISHPLLEIISGGLNTSHPPGYFVFLKLWSLVSQNIYWYRASSLLFYIINSFLLFKIGSKNKESRTGFLLTTFYAFSGYFIVFDWQFRMYTGLITLILFSYLFLNSPDSKRNLVYLFFVNLIGLFFDYGFLFYFLPLTVWLCLWGSERKKTFVFLFSLLTFVLLWGKSFLAYFSSGLDGISWIGGYVSPSFFVPFFLGSHSCIIFTIIFIIVSAFGFLKLIQDKKSVFKSFVLASAFSLVFVMISSIVFSPILHVRSLQVVGMSILIFYALGLSYLYKYSKVIAILFVILFVANCFFVIYSLPVAPGEYLISFSNPN